MSKTCEYEITLLNVALVILAIIAIIIGSQNMINSDDDSRIQENNNHTSGTHNLRVMDNMIDYIGLLIWPVIWDLTIDFRIMEHFPFTFLGFIWPMALIFTDLYFAQEKIDLTETVETNHRSTIGNIQIDATAVITIAFAMAGLLLSTDKNISSISSPMLMFALLFTIAFVIPSNDIHMSKRTKLLMFSTQRIFLNYAIGFVIAGITVNLSSILTHHEFYSYKKIYQKTGVSNKEKFHLNVSALQAAGI